MSSNKKLQKIKNAKKMAEDFRGVYVDITRIDTKPFRALLIHDRHRYSLGYYDNANDAAMAFNKKAKSLFKSEKKAQTNGYWNNF